MSANRQRWRIAASVLLFIVAIGVLVGGGVILAIVGAYGQNLPDVSSLSMIEPTSPTVIVARDGTKLARLYDKYKVYVPITQIPQVVREAMVATEDERFYSHRGVDVRGIMRAALANYQHEEITQGASTITQQLARKLFLNDRQTMTRKIQEALLAIEIERYYSKDEILERYLNLVYFGAGAYGVQAASHAYFGTDVSRLTLPQAAMLAGLVAAPSLYSPYNDLARAKDRQRHVLDRMVATGYISQEQADEAAAGETHASSVRPTTGSNRTAIRTSPPTSSRSSSRQFGYEKIYRGGLTVYTTLDPRLEDAAQKAVTAGVSAGQKEGYRHAPGRARRRRSAFGRDPRNGGWRRLLAQEPIQPRVAGTPSAGFVVQRLRLLSGRRQRRARLERL